MAWNQGALGRWNTSSTWRAGQDSKEPCSIIRHVDVEIDEGFREI
jgi:hypothetical protein